MSDTNFDAAQETLRIVDEVKAALRIPEDIDKQGNIDPVSDYRVAQMLGVSRATVSKWRQYKGGMSDETALRAAALTGADPAFYLLRVAMERTSSVGAAYVLKKLVQRVRRVGRAEINAKKIASILFGTLVVLGLAALPTQRIAASVPERDPVAIRIKSNRRRSSWRRFVRWLGTPFCGRNRSPLTHGIVTAPAF